MAKAQATSGASRKDSRTAGRSAVTGRLIHKPASKSGTITLLEAKTAVRDVLRDRDGRVVVKK